MLSTLLIVIEVILVFSALILIHEFGHFIVAKAVGIKVHEFSLGMGPRITGIKRGETEYNLRAIPIGGFIRPEGEDAESEDPRAFGNKPLWARAAVVAAGPISNFILAFIIIIALFTYLGRPAIIVGNLTAGMPAASSGLQVGDVITKINDKNVFFPPELIKQISSSKDAKISMTVIRNNKELRFNIPKVYSQTEKRFMVGVLPVQEAAGFVQSNYWENLKLSPIYLAAIVDEIGRGLKGLFTGQVSKDEVGGPVKIIQITSEVAKTGIFNLLNLLALLSLNLGIVNLFPIPALDGGRLIFFAIEGIRGKPIEQKKEAVAHMVGFVFLISLIILITINDIKPWLQKLWVLF